MIRVRRNIEFLLSNSRVVMTSATEHMAAGNLQLPTGSSHHCTDDSAMTT